MLNLPVDLNRYLWSSSKSTHDHSIIYVNRHVSCTGTLPAAVILLKGSLEMVGEWREADRLTWLMVTNQLLLLSLRE